jgi:regulator of sigma E protease
MNLKGLLTGDIAPKLLIGPFGMVKAAYSQVEHSFNSLILFLGIISINLAVVNFLPIPILDGGHMVFLIIEKLRGKPASERMLIIANSIGLIFILSLMLFVIFLDVSKMEFIRKWFML